MPRTKTSTVRRQGHNKIFSLAKGFRMTRNRLYKVAHEAVMHAGKYAFVGRKEKKQQFRTLWISRINSALQNIPNSPSYSRFIKALSDKNIKLNRKSLSAIAVKMPNTFTQIVKFSESK